MYGKQEIHTKFWNQILKGKTSLGVLWEDNINTDPKTINCVDIDWFHLAQDMNWWLALLNTVMKVLKFYKRREGLCCTEVDT